MATITFIRHGESEDNIKPIWAGWKDAPLSSLGNQQAKALAEFFSATTFMHVYASDLLRAHGTGKAVHNGLLADPKPPFTVTHLVREQYFGVAEGKPWMSHIPAGTTREELYSKGVYPVLYGRQERFEDGESLDDLALRAEQTLAECVLPHLSPNPEGVSDIGEEQKHIAIASHGLAISELIAALVRLDPSADKSKTYKGLLNTAWARAEVRIRDGHSGPIDVANPPSLEVKITHFNETKHLETMLKDLVDEVEETNGEARAFFGGGGADTDAVVPAASARAAGGQANL